MITIHYCIHRKPGMKPEDFAAYWRGPHAELVKSLAKKLGIVRYVQNHGVLADVAAQMQTMRGTVEPFDGVAAITFASPDDLARANTDPAAAQAQARLAQDEAMFIDIARSSILFTAPHTVIG